MSDKGFSILEVLFSLLMMSLISAGVLPAFLDHMKMNTANEIRVGAPNAAQAVLDELRFEEPSSLPSSGTDSARSVLAGTKTYQVFVSYCADATHCSAESRHLTILVEYNGKKSYEVETIYTQLR